MPGVDIAAATARADRLARAPGRALLGIAGAPAAGKSTLAAELAGSVDGSVVVPMDGFHLTRAVLRERGWLAEQGTPRTFDADGFVALLGALHAGASVCAPEFDRAGGDPVPDAIAVSADAPLVIVEGNYLLLDTAPWSRVPDLLDEVWFVETDEALRIEQLVARHERYGWAHDAALDRATHGSDADNARLVAATRERADLVVRLG